MKFYKLLRPAMLLLLAGFMLAQPTVSALTNSDIQSLIEQHPFYDPSGGSSICTGTAGTLPGFVPEPYNGAFTAGANKHNVSPALVAALFTAENFWGTDPTKLADRWSVFIKDHTDPNSGWPTNENHTEGPFQFLPSTWGPPVNLGDDGNNDGEKDPNNIYDAAAGAANYAETDKATVDTPVSSWSSFIFSYNHAQWYVDAVIKFYKVYAGESSPTSSATPSASSACNGGVGISPDGFVFPQKTTKAALAKAGWNSNCTDSVSEMGPNPPTKDPSKYANISGLCHHNYLAADIFNATGTPVVAVRPGRIMWAHDSGLDDSGAHFGMSVSIYSDKSLGGDGLWYFFQHMLRPEEGGGLKVQVGDIVKAGDQLGVVGTNADAENTPSHTHFDVSPVENGFHRGFDGTGGPLLDPMPVLKAAYNNLPEN